MMSKYQVRKPDKLVKKLIYLSHTRPDIAHSINTLRQFMHTSSITNMKAAHRYLIGTLGYGLILQINNNFDFEIYSEEEFSSSLVDHRSIYGIFTF